VGGEGKVSTAGRCAPNYGEAVTSKWSEEEEGKKTEKCSKVRLGEGRKRNLCYIV